MDQELLRKYRFKIFQVSSIAGMGANVIGATFASFAGIFDFDFELGTSLENIALWINILPFSMALLMYVYFVYPLYRKSATVETYRVKVLSLPMFFIYQTLVGWGLAIGQIFLLFIIQPQVPKGVVFLNSISAMGFGLTSALIGYYYLEHFNRSYWIPRLFNNRLEQYQNLMQPSIRTKFVLYYLGVSIAPILFLSWIVVWAALRHHILSSEQMIYIACYLTFILLFGIEITRIFSRLLHQPLLRAHDATSKIKRSDFEVNLPVSSNDELGILSERINDMASTLKDDASQIARLHAEIEQTQKEVVFTMGAIGESRSKETGNHVKRVAEYSRLLAQLHGLSEAESDLLRQASPMHDIGKVAIPDHILNKPGKLDQEEYSHMQRHAELGYEMLCHSERPLLKAAAIVANQHHEKFDGSGYPAGLAGEGIHIYGRITALVDVFDALGSERVYKRAWDDERIFELFREQSGKHFDPVLVDLFFQHLDQFIAIRSQYRDELV